MNTIYSVIKGEELGLSLAVGLITSIMIACICLILYLSHLLFQSL